MNSLFFSAFVLDADAAANELIDLFLVHSLCFCDLASLN
jgi:hypothetical protein